MRATHPLVTLLGYVGPHRKYAVLTVLFGTMGFLLSFVYPWIIGEVVDLVALNDARLTIAARNERLWFFTKLALFTGAMHALVLYGRGHFNVHLGDAIVTDIRTGLFGHLQRLGMRFYARERTGAILSRVLHDVHEATSIIYMGIVVVGMDAAQLLLAFVLLSQISPKLTLACVFVFPMYGIVFALMNHRVRKASERVRAQLAKISGNAAERLAGQALIKTYTAEDRETKRFAEDAAHHHALVVAQSHQGHLVVSWGEVLVHLGTTIVIGYGGFLSLRGEISAGELTRFLGYVVILYGPVRRFAELNITYQSSLSAMRRVFQLFEIEPSIVEAKYPRKEPPVKGHVSFERVRFRYGDASEEGSGPLEADEKMRAHREDTQGWVLDGVTMQAAPGERVAVVGSSGAGKTTLLSLVPRLYDVTQGRVLVDGVDVRDYSLFALRSAIAVVQQDSFVFTGSIRENIAYGRPDASEEEILSAAKAAHADEFIERLEHGYDTRLGERGVNFSGGQRQRLSIARAVLKNPRILILDEATSSLDAESERIVQEALEQLMRGRTSFIIAHRLSTVRTADRIVVLEDGRVAETGTHKELLQRGGIYARFVRGQSEQR